MEIVTKYKGSGLLQLILIIGGLATAASTLQLDRYVFCQDEQGNIIQESGPKIIVENNTVIVQLRDGTEKMFVNMNCWTENETTTAPIREPREDNGNEG